MNFTYDKYRELLGLAKTKGYTFSSYNDEKTFEKSIILRHDVDFSLNKALDLAKLENELGISSTFFVLVTSDFYNLFSKQSVQIMNQIMNLKHVIGLHFDEQSYKFDTLDQLKEMVYSEAEILGKLLGKPIEILSMHRPSSFFLENDIFFEGLINSYGSKYFRDMKYISDSRMHWREDVYGIIENCNYNKIHLLTHPFWYSVENETIKEKLTAFILQSKIERFEQIDRNFTKLNEFLNKGEIL